LLKASSDSRNRNVGSPNRRQQFAEQSSNFNDKLQQQAEQSRDFAARIDELERQLAAAGESQDSLARACEEAQLQRAEAESHREEQSRANSGVGITIGGSGRTRCQGGGACCTSIGS